MSADLDLLGGWKWNGIGNRYRDHRVKVAPNEGNNVV